MRKTERVLCQAFLFFTAELIYKAGTRDVSTARIFFANWSYLPAQKNPPPLFLSKHHTHTQTHIRIHLFLSTLSIKSYTLRLYLFCLPFTTIFLVFTLFVNISLVSCLFSPSDFLAPSLPPPPTHSHAHPLSCTHTGSRTQIRTYASSDSIYFSSFSLSLSKMFQSATKKFLRFLFFQSLFGRKYASYFDPLGCKEFF